MQTNGPLIKSKELGKNIEFYKNFVRKKNRNVLKKIPMKVKLKFPLEF